MAKNKRISTDALTEEEKNITKRIVAEKAKNINVSSMSNEADKLYKSLLGRVNASGYKSIDTLHNLTRDIYEYERTLSRLSLAGVDVSSHKKQASEIYKATGEQARFYSQFENEDSYWDNEYRNKYKNYTLADVDKILTDALDKPFFSANDNQRELKWLKDNRAYFMTDSELKDAISEGEEKSKEYSSQKSNATRDYISSSVSSALASQTVTDTLNTSIADNSLTGANKNDSLYNKKNHAKLLKTQNEEELDKYKRIYAQRESVTDEELKELYSQADERNIFDVLKKDYSYADYANDKDDKRIYGAEIVSRNYYKMNEQIDADTHIYSYTDTYGNEKTGSASDLLDKYISTKRILNSFGASSLSNIYGKEQASIRQAFESNGYDFDSALDAYERKINKESNEDMVGNVKESTEEHPVLSNAGSIATNILSGISTVLNSSALGLEDLLSDDVVMLDVNSPEWALKNVTDTVRNTTSQMLATEDYGELKSFLYQTGMSTVDFLATSLATGFNEPATLLLMSSNAGADAMKTVTENGGSASDALTMGIAAALFEALCEKVSVEQLFSSVNTTTGKEWLYNLVKGLVSEGSEEVATDLLNNVTDIILSANQSEFKQNVYEYMRSEGLGANEATKKVFEDTIKNMALSFAGGALSGGIMSGVGGTIGLYKVNNEYKKVGKNINTYEDGADTVLNFAREWINENQDDKKLEFDISKAENKASDKNIGRLYTSVQSNLENKINETAKNEAVKGIKSRVEELGLDSQLSNKAAEIIYKAYTDNKLTTRQRQILNENKYVKRAYNELVSSDSLTDSESYSNSWVNDVRLNIAQSTQNSVKKSNELKKLNVKNETSSMSESEIERRTARVQGSDKTVVVNKVVSKTDNGFIAQLSDGSEALIKTEDTSSEENSDLDTIAFNTMDMNKAVIYASNYKSTQTANAYIQAVVTSDNIENISSFQKAFNTVYQQGLQNKKMNISGLDITSTQAELAYISGKNDASVTENKINNKGTGASKTTSKRVDGTNIVHIIDTTEYKSGLTRLDSTKKLSNNTDTQLKVLDAYGKKHNLSFITVDTIEDGTVNGMQIGNNKIVIALDAEGGAYLSVAGHEVYHYLEKNNTSDADVIREFIINYLKNVDKNYDYDKNFKYFSEKYGTEDVKLIESEITANSMFEVLGNEETINQLAKENIGIFSRIKTVLEKFINELKDIIRGLPWKEKEALQDNIEILSVIKSLFDTAMENAKQEKHSSVIKYSYAGKKAANTSFQKLEEAIRLEDIGKASSEDIRKQTGWFRGYDGKWRIEIDDSKMIIKTVDITNGTTTLGEILSHDELFNAYPELNDITISAFPSLFSPGTNGYYSPDKNTIAISDDFLVNSKVEKELDEIRKSEEYNLYRERLVKAGEEYDKKRLELAKEFKKTKDTDEYRNYVDEYYECEDNIQAERIKDAFNNTLVGKRYNEIKSQIETLTLENPRGEIEAEFNNSELGKRYNKLIHNIDSSEISNNQRTRSVLIHEIQHAIQHIEGFSSGSSIEYWAQVPKENKIGTVENAIKERNKIGEQILETCSDEFIDVFRKYNREELSYDDISNMEQFSDDELDLLLEYDEWQDKISYLQKNGERSDESLYLSTAGEIEARDTSHRIEYNSEKRKNIRPDIDRTDVVFVNGDNVSAEIVTLKDGKQFVRASERVITGDNTEIWKKQVANYINSVIRNYNNLQIYTTEGDCLTITRDTAYKAGNRNLVKEKHGAYRKMNDEEFKTKLNAEVHINEIAEISKRSNKPLTPDVKNHKFAKDGFEYRNVFFQDFDGQYYKLTISIGVKENVSTVYNIGKIKKDTLPVSKSALSGSKAHSVSTNSITQSEANVNTKFSKKMISETEKSRQELLKTNDNLRVANTILINELRETGGKSISYKQSAQLAKDILSYFGSKYDKTTLTKELYDIFRWYDSNSSSYDYVCDYLSKIGEDVIKESGYLDTTLYDEYAEAREELRKMRFALPDKVLKQLNENYDGKFRQQTFGKMQLVSKAKNPDVMYLSEMYSELAAEYPNFFSIEDNEYEQPQKLLDFWSAIKPTYSDGINEMGFKDSTDAGIGFAYSVFEKCLDLPNHETFANRKKKEYQRNLNAAKKKLRQERDEKVAAVKKYYRNKIEENRLKRIDTQNKLKLRNNVISKVRRLSTALTSPTDSRHIPEQYKNIVTQYLMLFTEDSVVFDEARLQRVIDAYKAIDTKYENDLNRTDPDVLMKLENLLTIVKDITDGNRLSTLNLDETEEISVITDHLYHLIDNANKMVINGRKVSFNKIVSNVIGELNSQKSKFSTKFFDATSWNSTGYYFFKRIGGTLNDLYSDLLSGQHEYGLKMAQAQKYLQQLGEKYNVNQWMGSKKSIVEISNDTGDYIELSADEAMGIYAVYMREQLSKNNSQHLIKGGMTKDNTVVNGIENVQKIINSLTNEQIQYVKQVVNYLSTTVGDWGNETSLKMFGYKKFNEKWYYPFHIDSDFSKSGLDNVQQENNSIIPLIKNKSFTKSTVQGASNPIRVEKFTDVVSQHITEMICYNTLAEAQANLNAVYKYTDSVSSVRSSIARAYGNQAKKYISTLIKDISSGATNNDSNEWFSKTVGKFKKNAVAANLSVVVQQPSAIGRAMALVDPKYFLTSSPKNGYEELKKYSGVAVIREIGGFDISTSKGNAYWLMIPKPKEIKNKFKALANENYREDVLGWAAGKADELTWALIWQGVKNEVADTTKLKGEELLTAAGNRFNEVIEATRVYDSVLTRSQIMRSQGAFSKMATAFMAEPTKKVNMLMDAFYNFVESSDSAQKKNSGKMLMRTIGSILCATVINAVCKSFVSAGRDDDEYQSYVEKYIEALISNTISDLSVMQGFPIIKDVISIFQGYDISRTDMDMVIDLINSVQEVIALFDDNTYITGKDIGEVAMSFAGSVGALVGFPVTNILRDLTAIKRTIMSIFDDKIPTSQGIKYSSLDAFIESFDNIILNPFENLRVNEDDIYKDLIEGDLDKYSNDWDLYESYLIYSGKTSKEAQQTIRSKVKNIVKVHFLKEEITIEEAEKYLCEYLGDENGYWTAKKWLFENDEDNEGIEYNKYAQLKAAVLKGEKIDNMVKELTEHNTKISAVKSNISETIKEAFNEGQISETEAANKLQKYCDKSKDEANDKVDVWKFESKYPDSELSDSGIKQFKDAEKSGITLDVFEKYYSKRSELSSDKDSDGNIIRNSKKEKILNLINSLPITNKQKDVLYFQNNYSENTLNDAPWH